MPRKQLQGLRQCWLYAVDSPADLARRLSTPSFIITAEDLRELAKDSGNFRCFDAKDVNGKIRQIQEPKRKLQWVHRRIHRLLARVQIPDYLHSAVRGRSYLSNAATHDAVEATIKIDVKKFFQSVPRAAIFAFFREQLKCRRDVAALLADLLTFDAKLPTGSSASPIISFYAFKPMFDEISRFAAARKLKMTCYADDMSLSGALANKSTLFGLMKIIARHGLKSHKARAFAPSRPKVITGVCNTASGRRVPNRLHLKIKTGFEDIANAASQKARDDVLRSLLGRLDAAGQIDPTFKARARTLRSQIAASVRTSSGR
jgi:RNA-directed DNA polymerase